MLPNRATTVEMSLASHIMTIPSLFSPPPPSTTTTTTCHHCHCQAPQLTPIFGPTQGELVNTHATQDCHVTAPLNPQHHPNHHHVTRITATSPESSVWKSGLLPFWAFFELARCHKNSALKLGHLKRKISSLKTGKDWTDPEILCSKTLIVVGNFYYNVLAQKKCQKAQRLNLQTLPESLPCHLNHHHVTQWQQPPTFPCHCRHPDCHIITGQWQRQRPQPPVPHHCW